MAFSNYLDTKKKTTTGFSSYLNTKKTTGGSFSSYSSKSNDTRTADGLYKLAVDNGFKNRADTILANQKGEETKKIFSGGFMSDVFDGLNALQYGVVGMIKGKSFMDGVKTRQSFSDKDSLGNNGLPGVIAGIALDIAVDPLTYIAPWTMLKKIPGVAKGAKALSAATFGKKVTKAIDLGGEVGSKTYEATEGGTKLGKYLAQKFQWMSGADPVFKETFERGLRNTAVSTDNIVKMSKGIAKLTPEISKKLLTKDKTGRFMRVGLKELQKTLSPDDLETVSKVYNKLDDLGKEAVDLGLLSKAKYEEGIGEYIKNAYTEFELAKGKGIFGSSTVGIKKSFARVKDLSPEKMAELGQIDNPAYLLFKSAFDLSKNVENAKLFKVVAKKFGTDVAQEGFTQIPKTTKFITTVGKQAEILTGVKKINTDLKPLFKGLKQTFKADKKVLGEITGLEKQFSSLSNLQGDELYKFFNAGEKITEATSTARKLGTIPDALQPIANSVKKFDNFELLNKSDVSIKLEKLFVNGDLERNGFKSMEQFFDTVKNPFKAATTGAKETIANGSTSKLIKLQKQIESVLSKSKTLKEIDKRSINDSFRALEKNISDLNFSKEGLLENLADVKLGDLAGKYIPDHMKAYLDEIISPSVSTFQKQLVANFKFFKVVMNPGTHARNIISNKILNYWKLGMNPLDPRVIKSDMTALKEISKGSGKWISEAKPLGYSLDTFASAEMKTLLDSTDPKMFDKAASTWGKTKKLLGDMYQAEENQAKLSSYIFQRTVKKIAPEDAWKAAESATFNYAQVTPFVRKLRESLFGFPFITFTVKSTPVVAETLLLNPNRISVIGKIKAGIENLSDIKETDAERANEPPWVKDGFYIKLPMKDKQGRSSYFDLTYILPFGDLLAGNFFETKQDMQTGLSESQVSSAMKKSPFIQFVTAVGKNQDFYGNSIWKNSDTSHKQLLDLMNYITKTYTPPLLGDQLPGGYNDKGVRQNKGIVNSLGATDENQRRNLMQELLRNVGIKIQPIDADIQETFTEYNKKKALKNLGLENGYLNELNINYVPKNTQ